MFWQRENFIDERIDSGDLRVQLRERLRLVAEFATLGAYELTEPRHGDAPHAHSGEPTQRVFLFARAPETRCKGGREAVAPCPATVPGRQPSSKARGSVRHRMPRRRAGVEPAEQPCTWAAPAEPAPRSRRDR